MSRPKGKEIFEWDDQMSFYEHDKMNIDICSEMWYNAKNKKSRSQHQRTQIFFATKLFFFGHDKRGERMKLGELGSVRSGLVLARKQSKEKTEHRYSLLNLRSVLPDGRIDMSQAEVFYTVEPLKREYISQKGDVVVRLTAPYTAVLIDEKTAGMVISSHFLVIRIESNLVLPEYLFWLLNTSKVKRQMFGSATGNVLGAVKTSYLAEFDLKVIPQEQQKKLAELNFLAKRECQLLKELAEQKEKYNACLLERAYQSVKRGI